MHFNIVSFTVSKKTHSVAASRCSKDFCSSFVEIPSSSIKQQTSCYRKRMTNPALVAAVITLLMLVAPTTFAGNDSRPHMVPIESRNQPMLESGPETPSAIGNKSDASSTALGFYLSPGILLETSDYDLQHNSRMARQVTVGADGRVHFVWTHKLVGGAASTRAVHYRSYKNGILDAVSNVSGDLAKTPGSFCTVDVFANRGLVVNQYGAGPLTTSALDIGSGSQSFTAIDPPSGVVNCRGIICRGAFANYIWPVVAADQDGTGKLVIHIAAMQGNTSSGYNAITYFRGVSSGTSMDPGMYGTCGKFIDSTCATGYDIAAAPYWGWVVIAYPKSRTSSRENNDLAFRLSYDRGENWLPVVNLTDFATGALERVGQEVSVLFTADNCFHILYIGTIYDSLAGTVSDQEAKLYHYSSCNASCKSLVLDANNHDDASLTPAFEYNVCKINLTQCISSVLNDTLLYATYTRYLGTTASPDRSAKNYPNGEVFISASSTWGQTWGAPINLTNTKTNGCLGTIGSYCADDRYTSAARYSTDSLRIEYMEDLDAGSFISLESGTADLNNPVRFLSYPCIAMAPYQKLTCTPSSIDYPFYMITDSTTTLDLVLVNSGNQPLNWTSSLLGGDLPITLPASGTVPAGCSNSATITVTVGPKSYEGLFHNTIRFTYNVGTRGDDHTDVPASIPGINNYYPMNDEPLRTATVSLLVTQSSRVGKLMDVYDGFKYFLPGGDDKSYLFDGSLLIGTSPETISMLVQADGSGDAYPDRLIGRLQCLSIMTFDETLQYHRAYGKGGNSDKSIAFDVAYYAPKALANANFMIGEFSLYSGPTNPLVSIENVGVAFSADWDVPDEKYSNTGGVNDALHMVWQQGTDNRFAALSGWLEDATIPPLISGGMVLDNHTTFNRDGGGYTGTQIWADIQTTGYTAVPIGGDLNSMLVFTKNVTITPAATGLFTFYVIFAGQPLGDSLNGLKATVCNAKAFIKQNLWPSMPTDPASCPCNSCGDANSDEMVDISDVVFLIYYIFAGGAAPGDCIYPKGMGDANGDGIADISDVVHLIAYIFSGGNPPHCQVM